MQSIRTKDKISDSPAEYAQNRNWKWCKECQRLTIIGYYVANKSTKATNWGYKIKIVTIVGNGLASTRKHEFKECNISIEWEDNRIIDY